MWRQCTKHLLLIFIALTLAACGGLPVNEMPEVPPQAEREYKRALASVKKGHHKTAIKRFRKLAKKYPQLAGVHANLGMLYLKQKKLKKAETSLSKATELNPRNAIAQNYLGIVYRQQGRFDEAKQRYENAIKADADYAYAVLNLGILYDLYLFDMGKAIDHYQHYQEMTDSKDKMVQKWILDLKRRDTAANKNGGKKG